jgi:ribosomal-protein-alanine N-acetyltransferase
MKKTDKLPPDTDRLAFREWNDDDLDRFHAICSDPKVMQFVGAGRAWTGDRTGQFILSATEMLREHGYCQWPLIHKADGKLIGYCGVVNTNDDREIGWRLAPEYWGQGLATEAARAVLTHGIIMLGFERVIATVQAANMASIRIIEKLGMTLVERFDRDGREVLVYSVDAGCLTSC